MKASPDVVLIRRPVEWRDIPGYEGIYSITRDGRVWAHAHVDDRGRGGVHQRKGKWLKFCYLGKYRGIALYRERRRRNHYIHQLVMATWGPSKPSPLHEINHIDLDRTNNAIDNLEWVTRPQNIHHAIANGRRGGYESTQLTKTQILEIRARYTGKRGEQTVLAREFGVNYRYIWEVVHRKNWKHI